MTYYDDIRFDVIIHHFSLYSSDNSFTPENNSIEFIQRGKIKLKANGKIIELVAPALFWMKKGGFYSFIIENGQDSPCEHVYMDFHGPRTDKMIRMLEEICPQGYITPNDPELVEAIFADLIKKYRRDPVYYHPDLAVNAERLVLQAIQSARHKEKPQNDPYGIIAIANRIKSDPFGDYNFKELAAKAGTSYEHYRRLFREIHHRPPAAFVLDRKMFLAAEMLQKTKMRIKEIMTTCQFDSMMNFSRTFKRFSGLSPSDYRKKFQ
ncbi:MAG: helix-turn-helix transcriptional regulator [Lentisphaeria bacterium]|nr:helix-turn-helix transcriptional regulator [Lentisphaeria bacterium]